MNNVSKLDEQEYTVLWDLPQLPLTEKMGEFSGQFSHSYDQKLVMINKTGHVQLLNQLPSKELYTVENYNFRTSETNSSMRHLETFCNFVNSCVGTDRIYRSLVDIGGNDLAAIKRLRSISESAAVVDPICSPDDNKVIDNVKIIGRFVEEVDLSSELGKPDLVFCRHTIEHISNPWRFIEQLFSQCDEHCIYVFEMPSFASLVEAGRFDAIFHQHYHYFDLYSFKLLLAEVGGEILNHYFDHQGSCGGSLFVCFQKAHSTITREYTDIENRKKYIISRINLYQRYMEIQKEILESLEGKVYGYGGGLMLATLAYHLKFDLSRLECVLDDDPAKDLQTYANLPVQIRDFKKVVPEPDSNYLITSLENVRPIYRKISELRPRRVVVPCML